MRENGNMAKRMAMVFVFIQMEVIMRESGKMVKKMAKVFIFI